MTLASRRQRFALVSLLSLAVTAASPSAWADRESDAKDLFARGRDLRQHGDCNGATTLFRKAFDIYPQGLGSLRNLAECEEQIGHFASSRRAWLDLKRALVTAPADAKYESWDKDATEAAARLQPKVAQLFIDVIVKSPQGEAPATEKSDVELLVNGERVPPKLVNTILERDPGSYVVRLQAPDAKPLEETVHLSAGEERRITMRIVRTPIEVAAPTPEAPKSNSARTLGWAALGVGGASLVGAGIFLLVRNGALSNIESLCPGLKDCNMADKKDLEGYESRGQFASTMATVLGAVGVVGIGGGLALILTNPNAPASPTARGLTVTPGLARVDATWRF